MKRTPMSLLALVAALSMAAFAPHSAARETPPQGGEPREFRLPSADRYALPNDVPVALVPYGNLPKVTFVISIPAGNAHEGDKLWLADLAGELLTEGAGPFDTDQLAARTADMGGEIGVGVGVHSTQVSLTVLSEFAVQAVEILADVVRRPALPADAFERVRSNLLKNLAIARQQPQTQADIAFRKALFRDHPYGTGLPDPAALNALSIDDVRTFVATRFGANGARIYVAGRFDRAATVAALGAAFGDWPAVASFELAPPPTAPAPGRTFIERPDAPQSTVLLGLPVVDPTHPDYVSLSVLNTLLGGSFGSRITSNIREDKGYTYSPSSSISVQPGSGVWREAADVTTAVTGAAIGEIIYEIERLQREPPPAEELQRIKNYAAGIFVLRNATPGALIGQLRFLDTHGLTRAYLESYVQRVNAVTPADIQRLARTYLNVDDMTLVVVGDPAVVPAQLEALDKPPRQAPDK